MTAPSSIANAGVRFPPPFLFVAGIVLGWLLNRFVHPLPLIADTRALPAGGTVLVILGQALSISGIITFRRASTTIIPNQPASQLVRGGPYRFTRNPMYTGLTLTYLGVSVWLNSFWPLVLLPVVLVLLVTLVIRREEAYLASAFGTEYSDYRARVRRWL
jgi:protein-S-isoprenylcysteine O-methyltransferase Ste14